MMWSQRRSCEKLSTYAALLGVIGAIGGGFYTWGQFNSRLDALEGTPPVNLKPLHEKDKELTKQFDDVLLYANEYKVDLIDRIKKVDDKIQPVDLTIVFKEIAKVREQIAMIDIPEDVDLKPISKEHKRLNIPKCLLFLLPHSSLRTKIYTSNSSADVPFWKEN